MNWINTQIGKQDERAVSPVIGVILMVAVTVILAAVVSTLVLGMSNEVESTPQSSFDFAYDGSSALVISHTGGGSLDADSVTVKHGIVTEDWPADNDGKISAGDSQSYTVSPGDTVTVVWMGNNDNSAILATYQVPS